MGGDLTVNSIPTDRHLKTIFSPGAGDLSCNFSVKPLNRENRKSRNYYCLFLHPLLSFLAFWNLNTVPSLDSGAKIYDAQTLFCCLGLSPGSVCFETFDYLRMPHQRAFDPIFYFFVKSPPIARTLIPRD